MVKLIIRDDDCNYFTTPEDLEVVYSSIPFFPISFAVVPRVTDVYGGCPETNGNFEPRPIGDNDELVSYLKNKFIEGRCDILLHGITHGYKFNEKGIKIPEMVWRDKEPDLKLTIYNNKKYLEDVFGISISCFVAPSNRICRNGIRAVYDNKMNYSGIIPIDFQRDFDYRSFVNYAKRMWVRLITGLPYPNVLIYEKHKEMNACNTISYNYLKRMFQYCQINNSPMAINVHYWHIREHPEHYRGFFDFIHYAIDNGAQPSRMRDCL